MKILAILLISVTTLIAQSPQNQPITINSITPVGSNAVSIAWSGAIPPYKLQVARDSASRAWSDASYHIYGRSARVEGVTGNVFFRVRTVKDVIPPPALRGFSALLFSPGYVLLEWDPLAPDNPGGTGIRGVLILRNGEFLAEVLFPATQYVDVTAQQGEVYTYTATVLDEALNQSPVSGSRVVSLPIRSVILAWDANPEPDIAGYVLSYGDMSGIYSESVDVGNVITYTLYLGEAMRDEIYYFVVCAYNLAGLHGPYSNQISYRIP